MFHVFLCLAVLVAVQAATMPPTTMDPMMTTTKKHHNTHAHHSPNVNHSHATKEPSEHDNLRFAYDSHTHMMVVVNNKACQIFTLSDSERTAVHTDVGIRTLELKFLNMLSTGTSTEVMLSDQPKTIQRLCAHVQHLYMVV